VFLIFNQYLGHVIRSQVQFLAPYKHLLHDLLELRFCGHVSVVKSDYLCECGGLSQEDEQGLQSGRGSLVVLL
jgi:hypothetical protein